MSNEQPKPIINGEDQTPVMPFALEEYKRVHQEQYEKGLQKYGTTLTTNNGRDPGEDAMQEYVDLGNYLNQLRIEYKELQEKYQEALDKIKRLEEKDTNLIEEVVNGIAAQRRFWRG